MEVTKQIPSEALAFIGALYKVVLVPSYEVNSTSVNLFLSFFPINLILPLFLSSGYFYFYLGYWSYFCYKFVCLDSTFTFFVALLPSNLLLLFLTPLRYTLTGLEN